MLQHWRAAVMVVALALVSSQPAVAQVSRQEFEALKAEIEALKGEVRRSTEALKQLQELMRSTRGDREAFREVVLSTDGAPFQGKPDAKVTIVEFSDFQCPFCARYARDTFPQIERDYIRPGRVKYVFRDFPIASIHPQAFKAHEAVHCAGEQGKRWEMHEKVFANQRAISAVDLAGYAQALGLDTAGFKACIGDGRHAPKIRKSLEAGQAAGVRGTPTFFIGLTESDGSRVKAVRRIVGAQPHSAFKAAIEELLAPR